MLDIFTDILDRTDLKHIHSLIEQDSFVDGRKTAGFRAKQVKKNEQMDSGSDAKKELNKLVIDRLMASTEFQRFAFPKKIRPPLISRYNPGMEYGYHVDDALMGKNPKTRTDISVTVFLNNPDDYEGGELEMDSPFGPQTIKLPAGCAVAYPSLTLHRVAPVTKGERLVAVTWLESYIRDPHKREILRDLDLVRRALHKSKKDAPETDLAFKSYANLQRMWSET
ncbi:Fe2+-dependent dioxygenase [Sneathiella limimaris]|uniref:Fe2+-dependent dioxygenase n=1 Tax=Sneathiella limimaris TaxID=1964213 RepID=UPI00146F76B1|nr:Fe2+-dependent dioxygenase [Sneathiella limimaris]